MTDGPIAELAYRLYFTAPKGHAPTVLRELLAMRCASEIEVDEFFHKLALELKRRIFIEETPNLP